MASKIKKGIKINQITSVMDIFPTLVELTNNSSNIEFDGKSFNLRSFNSENA